MNDIRKYINLLESVESSSNSIELTDFGVENKEKLQELVSKAWPNVTYQGIPILNGDNNYYDQLYHTIKTNKRFTDKIGNSQEVYLGYDIVNNVFYTGYDGDPWEEPKDHDDDHDDYDMGAALFKIKFDDGHLRIMNHKVYPENFYRGVYHMLKNNPNIIHLRLD